MNFNILYSLLKSAFILFAFLSILQFTRMTLYIFHFHARSRDFALEYGKRLFCIEHDEMVYRHEPLDVQALLGHTRTRIRRSKSAEVARRSPTACRHRMSGCAPMGLYVCVRTNTYIRHGDLCTMHSMNSELRDRESTSSRPAISLRTNYKIRGQVEMYEATIENFIENK